MNAPYDIHTGGYTELRQGVVYDRQLRPIKYRCASCGELHPWAEKLRDEETGRYHGVDCASPVYLARVAADHARAQAAGVAAAARARG
jgi:hypothetical protein